MLLACIVALPMAALAQKPTIDELLKPYDAKARAEPAPPSSGQMDRQLVVLPLGGLAVLIIGSAIYWFRRHSAQRKQIERDRVFLIERDRPLPPLRAAPAEPIDS